MRDEIMDWVAASMPLVESRWELHSSSFVPPRVANSIKQVRKNPRAPHATS